MVRPLDDRVIAGVALAVANKLGMSPGAVRVIWFVLAFFGGVGILLYIAGWLLIPEEGETQSVAESAMGRLSDSTAWLGVALIVVAVVMLVTLGGWIRADLAWAVALLAVGVLLYRGQLDAMFRPRPEEESDTAGARSDEIEDAEASDDAQEPAGSGEVDEPLVALAIDGEQPPPAQPAAVEQQPRPSPRRRDKSILGRLTIGAGFLAVGLMAVLDSAGIARPAFSHYMALFVGIIGLGLIVGSVMGRSRGLIFLGVLLVPIMLASSVVSARFTGGWGDRDHRPSSISQVEAEYNLTGGDLVVDLSYVDFGSEELRIEGDVGFGRLLVIVPDGISVDAQTHVGFGDIQVFGEHRSGVDVERAVFVDDGPALLELHLDVGFGELEIREVSR